MKSQKLLSLIDTPGFLRRLNFKQIDELCAEIRGRLIEVVSANGGHLASNLGVVELTVVLHRVFSSPRDQIIWDVGHQCYTHKLLTGRRDRISELRQKDGLSGFPKTGESIHDAFLTGHSSTSLSVACGLARGKELRGEKGHVIAVIGDGALTGGLAFEGLNNLAQKKDGAVIVVLNDNKMSISKNVGGFTKYLSWLRTTSSYYKLKDITKSTILKVPVLGEDIADIVSDSLAQVKNVFYHSGFFEGLGYTYMGPVDGHDAAALQQVLLRAKKLSSPVLLHVETVKGKGYPLAEKNPGGFHGVSKFNPKNGDNPPLSCDSFSEKFGRKLTELAKDDDRIVAVTAAMKYATGLHHFEKSFKESGRFFDVGIAEGHGVTFCAGLASKGLIPVFAVYSSFLQRGYDQLVHDCAIEPRHVVIGVDRAGLIGEDGETHHGIFDCAFLSGIPGVAIYSPSCYSELEICMEKALGGQGITAVRYPRGPQPVLEGFKKANASFSYLGKSGGRLIIVSYGRIFGEALKARGILKKPWDISVSLLKLTKVWPLDSRVMNIAAQYENVMFVEEGIRSGGIGESFLARLFLEGYKGNGYLRAIEDKFIPQASVEQQLKMTRLDADSIVQEAREILL